MAEPGAARSRLDSIDLIKGFAIIAVIFLHTLSARTLHQTVAVFHISQAVPVFMLLLGFNGAASLRRKHGRTLREAYTREYLSSRFDRIFVPFVVTFVIAAALAALVHKSHYGIFTPIGELPLGGPGNYFITLLFQFALLLPLIYWGLQRSLALTLSVCLAIDVGFEISAPHVGFINSHPYIYSVCFARYLFLVGLGGALSGVTLERLLHSRWLWFGGALSVAYLGLVYGDVSAIPFGEQAWRSSAFAIAFYPALLVVVGLRSLPAQAHGWATRAVAELGRASYHIFLIQILWFGLFGWTASLWALLINLVVTFTVGLIFYRAMSGVTPAKNFARGSTVARTRTIRLAA